MSGTFDVRVARPEDKDRVTAVLEASYPVLLASAYDPEILRKALPLMTRANFVLLASGTYHLAVDGSGQALGCGGWTFQRPGAPNDPVDPALAHVRHFAVRPEATGRGVGRALFERCAEEARHAGAKALECNATLAAEGFYRAMGFSKVRAIEVPMGPGLAFPSLLMRRDL